MIVTEDFGKIIPYRCKTNEQWRIERSHSIGASSVGVLFGETHFRTPIELQEVMKAELRGEFNYEENEAMQDGHDLEEFVAKKFSRKTGKKIIQASSIEYLLRREKIPFMHASPDRTYWIDPNGKQNDANKGLLECKTTNLIIDEDNLPQSWIFQVQVQMGIGGFKEAYIAWLSKRTFTFGKKKFEYNPAIFEAAVEVCRDFWERYIIGDETPDPVAPRDIVKLYPSSITGKTITANEDICETVEAIKEAQEAKKELDETISELKEKLILQFDDAEAIVAADTGKPIVTYKTKKGAMRVDSKKLKADFPEVYEQVAKQDADSRTLLIK